MTKLLKKKQHVITDKEEIILKKLALLKTQVNIAVTDYRIGYSQLLNIKDINLRYEKLMTLIIDYNKTLESIDTQLNDIEMELAYNER